MTPRRLRRRTPLKRSAPTPRSRPSRRTRCSPCTAATSNRIAGPAQADGNDSRPNAPAAPRSGTWRRCACLPGLRSHSRVCEGASGSSPGGLAAWLVQNQGLGVRERHLRQRLADAHLVVRRREPHLTGDELAGEQALRDLAGDRGEVVVRARALLDRHRERGALPVLPLGGRGALLRAATLHGVGAVPGLRSLDGPGDVARAAGQLRRRASGNRPDDLDRRVVLGAVGRVDPRAERRVALEHLALVGSGRGRRRDEAEHHRAGGESERQPGAGPTSFHGTPPSGDKAWRETTLSTPVPWLT